MKEDVMQTGSGWLAKLMFLFIAFILLFLGISLVCLTRLERQSTDMSRQLTKLQQDLNLGNLTPLQAEASTINDELAKLHIEIQNLVAASSAQRSSIEVNEPPPSRVEEDKPHNVSEAATVIAAIPTIATAKEVAQTLADLDGWTINPEQEKAFVDMKLQLAVRLRTRVKEEVLALQQAALSASTGVEGLAKHSEAGETLALYPMSQDEAVLKEAKELSGRQTELAVRLEVIRRQRYNLWATQQIEAAINDYNKNSSYWSPEKENKALIDALVKNLGPVDPALLEPIVFELYNYVVQRTKDSISEPEKSDLAKRLTDPSNQRKTFGDF
jgi:hypothetical protein